MGKPLMKVSSNSWIKGFKKANKTFVGLKRIGIGPNYEAFPVFNNTISSIQQSCCLVLAL
jgi:hypothetical protein